MEFCHNLWLLVISKRLWNLFHNSRGKRQRFFIFLYSTCFLSLQVSIPLGRGKLQLSCTYFSLGSQTVSRKLRHGAWAVAWVLEGIHWTADVDFATLSIHWMRWPSIHLALGHVSLKVKGQKDVKMPLVPVQEECSVLTAAFTSSEAPFGALAPLCCPVTGWHWRGIGRPSEMLHRLGTPPLPEGSQQGPLSCWNTVKEGRAKGESKYPF